MSWGACLTILAALGLTIVGTSFVRNHALAAGLLDEPNARSSHSTPTPRGGGIAIVTTCVLIWVVLLVMGLVEKRLALTLCLGGFAVAAVGFVDDCVGVDARIRLVIHLTAATFAVAVLGSPIGSQESSGAFDHAWLLGTLGVLGIGWFLNLFNFMDGIDGLASSEAAFISLAAVCLQVFSVGWDRGAFATLVVAGAATGFLYWNYPPAKIFMGDTGSGFLGYALAILAVSSTRGNVSALFPWLTLGGVFLADSSVTLLRRALRGERVYQAHRTHAYQRLARRWRSHRRVTLTVLAINLFYLLPLAAWESLKPQIASTIFLLSLMPLVVAAAFVGAGRSEDPVPGSV